MNQFIVVGRFTADPVKYVSQNGKTCAQFSIAERVSDQKTNFFNCQAWDKIGDIFIDHFHKGDQVVLFCRVDATQYQRKDGTFAKNFNLIVQSFEFGQRKQLTSQTVSQNDTFVESSEDDSFPF